MSWISDPRKQSQSQEARPGPRRDNKYRPEEDVSQWPPPGTKYTGGVLDQLTYLVCVLHVLLITIYIAEHATNS